MVKYGYSNLHLYSGDILVFFPCSYVGGKLYFLHICDMYSIGRYKAEPPSVSG